MRQFLQDDVIISDPSFGKYINKLELYIQWPPRRAKYTDMTEIENTSCVRSVMKVTIVDRIEREH